MSTEYSIGFNQPMSRRECCGFMGKLLLVTATGGFVLSGCIQRSPQQIRDDLIAYEKIYRDSSDPQAVEHIYTEVKALYNAVYSTPPLEAPLLLLTNEQLRKDGKPPAKYPEGYAGVVIPTTAKQKQIIPATLIMGDTSLSDPSLSKLSVYRAILGHEYVHTQSNYAVIPNGVEVIKGHPSFSFRARRGFKWLGVHNYPYNEKGRIFDEIHVQLIAEDYIDPDQREGIFKSIAKHPLYSNSLDPDYIYGADILRSLYGKLGIPVKSIQNMYYRAYPKELIERLDLEFSRRGINLSLVQFMIDMSINANNKDDLQKFRELVERI